jgi:hypothetical protein
MSSAGVTTRDRRGTRAKTSSPTWRKRWLPGFGFGVLADDRSVAARDETRASAVVVERGRTVVEEDAHPHLGVEGAPEEHRLLDLAVARAAERVGDRRAVPVLPGDERRRVEQPVQHGSLSAVPPELGRREADLLAAPVDDRGQGVLQPFPEHPPVPAVADDRVRGQREDVLHELLVEEREPCLEGVRHRGAVLVTEQRRERVRGEVLEQPQLEVVGDAVVDRAPARVHEGGCEQAPHVHGVPPLTEAPAHQRPDDVA